MIVQNWETFAYFKTGTSNYMNYTFSDFKVKKPFNFITSRLVLLCVRERKRLANGIMKLTFAGFVLEIAGRCIGGRESHNFTRVIRESKQIITGTSIR